MNRHPRHRTISSSERFGYVRLGPGRITLDEGIARLCHADRESARMHKAAFRLIRTQADQTDRMLDNSGRIIDLVKQMYEALGRPR